MDPRLISLRELVDGYTFTFASEASFQSQFEYLLQRELVPYRREVKLRKCNRPDFVLWSNVVVECKVGGGENAHLRQLKRYADCADIAAVVLLGTRPYGLPESLSGKPCLSICVLRL